MPTKVKLDDILEAIEFQTDESRAFLDLDSGAVEVVSLEALNRAEVGIEDSDLPQWQRAEAALARKIQDSDRYVRMPTKWDIHEWEIMQQFCWSVGDEGRQADLLDAIHGSGAFRVFRDRIHRYRLQKDWEQFRSGALRRKAIKWCEEAGIEYVAEP
jgi:hypothetical protein